MRSPDRPTYGTRHTEFLQERLPGAIRGRCDHRNARSHDRIIAGSIQTGHASTAQAQPRHPTGGSADRRCRRDRRDPRPQDAFDHRQLQRARILGETHAHDRRRDAVRGRHRPAEMRGGREDVADPLSAAKPSIGCNLTILWPRVLMMRQPPAAVPAAITSAQIQSSVFFSLPSVCRKASHGQRWRRRIMTVMTPCMRPSPAGPYGRAAMIPPRFGALPATLSPMDDDPSPRFRPAAVPGRAPVPSLPRPQDPPCWNC